jgi:hypothetical protein
MILVIFGAGASYDSLPEYPPSESQQVMRPPLADQLFEDRPIFRRARASFPAIQPIVPFLARRGGRSLEQQLQALAGEAAQYPDRWRQLMAVRYYIQYILQQIEDPWLREVGAWTTNYKALLDELDRCVPRDEIIGLVTFNYDRLIEEALRSRGRKIDALDHYISDVRFKLFKLHGSIDWVRSTGVSAAGVASPANQWGAMAAVTERAPSIQLGAIRMVSLSIPTGMDSDELVAPAIAVPLEDKTTFECPEQHLDMLQAMLPSVTRILVVGWRATEQHFLRILAPAIGQPVPVSLACGSQQAGEDTAQNLLRAGLNMRAHATSGGFTDLVTARQHANFFAGVQ